MENKKCEECPYLYNFEYCIWHEIYIDDIKNNICNMEVESETYGDEIKFN